MKIIEGIDSKILMNSHSLVEKTNSNPIQMHVIFLSSYMAQNLGSRNLIHHQKYNQVMEPQQLIVQIAKIRNTKRRTQCSGTGFRLIPIEADHGSWKAI